MKCECGQQMQFVCYKWERPMITGHGAEAGPEIHWCPECGSLHNRVHMSPEPQVKITTVSGSEGEFVQAEVKTDRVVLTMDSPSAIVGKDDLYDLGYRVSDLREGFTLTIGSTTIAVKPIPVSYPETPLQTILSRYHFLMAAMRMGSPKMNGKHPWRLRSSGWPLNKMVGPNREAAIDNAIDEVRLERMILEEKGKQ